MLDDRLLGQRLSYQHRIKRVRLRFMAFIIITGSLMTLRLAILLLSMQFRRFI